MNQQRSLYDESPLLSQDAAIGLLQSLGILSLALAEHWRAVQSCLLGKSIEKLVMRGLDAATLPVQFRAIQG